MMVLQACIFDLDGVIVDTAKYHYLAWGEIARELGFEFTIRDNEKLKGVSRMQSLDILLHVGGISLDPDKKAELAEKKNNIYLSYIYKMTKDEILPGVTDFLTELKRNKVKTALGSASKNAPLILSRLGIESLFDVVVDGNKVAHAKPDPEVFVVGAKELKIGNENCVVFEDAEAGIEAAIRAGMKCVGVGDIQTLGKANTVIQGFENFSLDKLMKLIN